MLKLYNTLNRKKEDFTPLSKMKAKVYSCGPTVYSNQHIGNMRAAIFQDIIRRSLSFLNFEVTSVQNITDVGHLVSDSDEGEDKMLKAAKKENKDPFEIAKHYTDLYLKDLKRLHVKMPTYMPKATEEIPEQIEIIQKLMDKGFAYKLNDGIYFDVAKFDEYGALSGQSLEEKQAGARVEVSSDKHNPQDFALWKFLTGDNVNHIMKWESPWGLGFPGWHIECSAMSAKYLGDQFDIHTGGIEHIPVHHENEIAQNVCSGAVKKVNYWLHNAHLQVDGEKMSKSIGNVYLIEDLVKKGYNPLAFRELILRTHYRKPSNFTFESLDAGEQNVKKINDFFIKLQNYQTVEKQERNKIVDELISKSNDEFTSAIEDDFNTPLALAAFYEFMNEVNKLNELSRYELNRIIEFTIKADEVLGLLEEQEEIPKKVVKIAKERMDAKNNKDWNKADELRAEIEEMGYTIKDDKTSKDGFIISKS